MRLNRRAFLSFLIALPFVPLAHRPATSSYQDSWLDLYDVGGGMNALP